MSCDTFEDEDFLLEEDSFLDEVELTFHDKPHVYNDLMNIIEGNESTSLASCVIHRVTRLLHGYPELIKRFSSLYLPDYNIEVLPNELVKVSYTNDQFHASWTIHPAGQRDQDVPVHIHEAFRDTFGLETQLLEEKLEEINKKLLESNLLNEKLRREQRRIKKKQLDSIPNLTVGAIRRILKGECLENPVMQIMCCRKIPRIATNRYRLLLSDGVTTGPFVMLGTQLNHMVLNKKLEKFTVVRVESWTCNQEAKDRKVIVLTNLTVLALGEFVEKKIVNSANSSVCGSSKVAATNTSAETGCSKMKAETTCDSLAPVHLSNETSVGKNVTETDCLKIDAITDDNHNFVSSMVMQMMFPALTYEALNQMLNGEDVSNAVLQIIGYKKLKRSRNNRYCFLVSDGVTLSPFVLLSLELNNLIASKELEEFTIVQVKKYVFIEIDENMKAILFLKLSVVVPGNEVNEKLGNPVFVGIPTISDAKPTCKSSVTETGFSETKAGPCLGSSVMKEYTEPILESQLTNGAIMRMLQNEDVDKPILKIVACKKKPGDDHFTVCIFDGSMAWPSAKLGLELSHLVKKKKFIKCPFQVDKYACKEVPGKPKTIVLLGVTFLALSKEVDKN